MGSNLIIAESSIARCNGGDNLETGFTSYTIMYRSQLTAGVYTGNTPEGYTAAGYAVESLGEDKDGREYWRVYKPNTGGDVPTQPPELEISKSKVTTNLDDNYQATVTFSLPGAEEMKTIL